MSREFLASARSKYRQHLKQEKRKLWWSNKETECKKRKTAEKLIQEASKRLITAIVKKYLEEISFA
ncbi:hypothetical protein PR048_001703 [Dryococelus australis]|uniref:Uncharacterized protein n=1 Tax=Dryococelus australis TaxID=614101 RepID=A0ABQ9II13_9NEOP|nr:hypothetical protein PR048_001703 [Dryococelus australis]